MRPIFLLALLSSCSLLTRAIAPPKCESQEPRCDGANLVICQDDLEIRINCDDALLCDENAGICLECGDGVLTAPEDCDDGNLLGDDGCSALCQTEFCGNGLTEGNELCDDGNTTPGDGCSDVCTLEVCGDGIVQSAEECDNGVNNSDTAPDSCRTDCTNFRCGDNVIDTLDECDDGNLTANDGCDADCIASGATAIAVGNAHSCALLRTQDALCFGGNTNGTLGYGNTTDIGDDEEAGSGGVLSLGAPVLQLATGGAHSCALLDKANVRCWGNGGNGRLGYASVENIGDNETAGSGGDIDVGGDVSQVATGGLHTCALLTGGNVRCWGGNFNGQLGYGNFLEIGDDETPSNAGDVVIGGVGLQLTAGSAHTCVVLDTKTIRCWGSNFTGQLGYGNTNDIGDDEGPAVAGDVNVGGEVSQLSAGGLHTCAILDVGNVRCWGNGTAGQLGYGNTNTIGDDDLPVDAGDIDIGAKVAQVAAGGSHTCALAETGAVFCWGDNSDGQLGYGNTAPIGDTQTPQSAGPVLLGEAATQISAGATHNCALLTSGVLRCWGSALNGRLGYGNITPIGDSETPDTAGDVPLF